MKMSKLVEVGDEYRLGDFYKNNGWRRATFF